MKPILFYDTETTGLPNWKVPSEDESQPHIVQLGAILADDETGDVIQSMDMIILPDGWEIPEEASEIHGITTEMALKVGIPENVVLDTFLAMRGNADRVAHNRTFDQRIIRIACKRYSSEDVIDRWAEKDDHHCTMLAAAKIIGGKWPKLEEAYKHFTGKDLENAHTAMADTKACMEIYFAIKAIDQE